MFVLFKEHFQKYVKFTSSTVVELPWKKRKECACVAASKECVFFSFPPPWIPCLQELCVCYMEIMLEGVLGGEVVRETAVLGIGCKELFQNSRAFIIYFSLL